MHLKNQLERILAVPLRTPVDVSNPADTGLVLPFLKWAGGKRWLMPLATELRGSGSGLYIEPFLGSGAMFFGLHPARALLSDCNVELIETYKAIADDWQAVHAHLRRHDRLHSKAHYYSVRDQRPRNAATRAARFIYLNRTCWNGLYRVNRQGVFNTPIGTKTRAILATDDFEAVANLLRRAHLVAGDFETQIDAANEGDLIFADPPYTVRHQYNGFVKYNEQLFSWADQERLCAALARAKDRGANVICTNADHWSIRELYERDFKIFPLERYSSIAGAGGTRGRYAEVVIIG